MHLAIRTAVLALLSLSTTATSAHSLDWTADAPRASLLMLVDGWWEQEYRTDAPARYWRLSRAERKRYDEAQARIERRHKRYHLKDYDRRDDRDVSEQRRLLDYE
jgi:hypothetical protein